MIMGILIIYTIKLTQFNTSKNELGKLTFFLSTRPALGQFIININVSVEIVYYSYVIH